MKRTVSQRHEKYLFMDESFLLGQLLALAEYFCISVRYVCLEPEDTPSAGGLCRVNGKDVILIDQAAPPLEQAHILAGALRTFDVNGVYVRPRVREFLSQAGCFVNHFPE